MESTPSGKQFAITMTSAAIGAVLLGNVVTLAADWFMQVGTPNTAGIMGAIIGGFSAGLLATRHLTQQDRDLN